MAAGFPRSECQVRKLATSHCTKGYMAKSVRLGGDGAGVSAGGAIHPAECTVTTCRAYPLVRKGGGFFYGKSTSNENHTEGV